MPTSRELIAWLLASLVVNALFYTASGLELLVLATESTSRALRLAVAQCVFAAASLCFLTHSAGTRADQRWHIGLAVVTFGAMGLALVKAAMAYRGQWDIQWRLLALASILGALAIIFALVSRIVLRSYRWNLTKRSRWLGIAGVVLLLTIAAWPEHAGSLLGAELLLASAGTALLGLAALLSKGPMPTWLRWPRTDAWLLPLWNYRSLVAVVLVLAGLARNTHDVRTLPMNAGRLLEHAKWRLSLDDSLTYWYARHKDANGQAVAVLVAAAGGGVRASYWTAAVLSSLDRIEGFRNHIFVISSVSGGSLGAAAFRAAITTQGTGSGIQREVEPEAFKQMLSADFLGPLAAGWLFSDVASTLLPFDIFPDRAEALERSWERAWRRTWGDDRMASDFRELWPPSASTTDGAPSARWPHLVLNGSSLTRGVGIVTTDIAGIASGAEAFPRVLEVPPPVRFRASTAINNSARFPVLEPPGQIVVDRSILKQNTPGIEQDAVFDYVVDGGYIDNYGTHALVEILNRIRTFNCRLVRDHGQRPVDLTGCDHYERAADAPGIVPVVIQITSDPELPRSAMDSCGCLDAPAAWGMREPFGRRHGISIRGDVPYFTETFAPAAALDRMRQMSGIYAAISLATRRDVAAYFHFSLGLPYPGKDRPEPGPSLNWVLSARSQRQLDEHLQQCQQLQTGVLTAMIGAPGQVSQLNRKRREEAHTRASRRSDDERAGVCR